MHGQILPCAAAYPAKAVQQLLLFLHAVQAVPGQGKTEDLIHRSVTVFQADQVQEAEKVHGQVMFPCKTVPDQSCRLLEKPQADTAIYKEDNILPGTVLIVKIKIRQPADGLLPAAVQQRLQGGQGLHISAVRIDGRYICTYHDVQAGKLSAAPVKCQQKLCK